MLREVMQREVHAARSEEACCRLSNTAPVGCFFLSARS
jgi:hypothetical protein